ncbi:MAG: fumarate hydratase C-terminal domain-containing protein [Sedimentisphaeraceae bacterium JB056]
MADNVIDLKLPLSSEDARKLKIGDIVTVSGMLFTGRSRFHIRAVENDILPPIDYGKINCFFHVGPVMRKADAGWEIVSIEPTSSIRFERYGGDVVRKLNLRTLIGKTTMGPDTAAALAEVGGVHLTKIGICGNQISQQVRKIHDVYFLDELGKTEATWVFEVEKFGPFFVDIDSTGRNYFDELDSDVHEKLNDVAKSLGIPENFDYTQVNAAK